MVTRGLLKIIKCKWKNNEETIKMLIKRRHEQNSLSLFSHFLFVFFSMAHPLILTTLFNQSPDQCNHLMHRLTHIQQNVSKILASHRLQFISGLPITIMSEWTYLKNSAHPGIPQDLCGSFMDPKFV